MMARGRGKVVDLEECHLVDGWFTDALVAARSWWEKSEINAYHSMKDEGALRTLTLREGKHTSGRLIMLTVSGNPEYALAQEQIKSFIEAMNGALEGTLSIYLRIQQVKKGQPTQFYEMHLYGPECMEEKLHLRDQSLSLNISPSAFFQPNTLQAEKFYELALQMANIPDNAVIYDLYCGTGTLGMLAAKSAKQVIGIELSAESSLDARENIKANHIANMEVITGDVGKVLKEHKEDPAFVSAHTVIVDPPRMGLSPEAITHIVELKPEQILYISCNPVTQAENIAELATHGYTLKTVQPVDQFPHTRHLENIALLSIG
jgi:23S rRNA (uracil1939-C5)-methyltransferase